MTKHDAPRVARSFHIDVVKHGVDTNQELTPIEASVFPPHVIVLRAVVTEQGMENHAAHRVDERWSPLPTHFATRGHAGNQGIASKRQERLMPELPRQGNTSRRLSLSDRNPIFTELGAVQRANLSAGHARGMRRHINHVVYTLKHHCVRRVTITCPRKQHPIELLSDPTELRKVFQGKRILSHHRL